MRYINEVHLNVNPADVQGMNTGNFMMNTMQTIDSKFIQPGFVFKHDTSFENKGFYTPSLMHLKFVNGYERKYNIGIS